MEETEVNKLPIAVEQSPGQPQEQHENQIEENRAEKVDEIVNEVDEVKKLDEIRNLEFEPKPASPKFQFKKINWGNKKLWLIIGVILALIIIIFLAVWIRTQNIPQLKDAATQNYTLGPDLDPFLFLRHAQEISTGNLQNPDMMRAAPLGFKNYAKTNLMPWAIVFLFKSLKLGSIEFAAIIAPVIFFALTLLVFFFFVKKLFSPVINKRKALFIALIATAFYAVIPQMVHRTTAGIPEIESLGMLWFWSAFYFFTTAWQENKIKKQIIFGILAGIFTGLMIFTWGGYRYIFMAFTLTAFIVFFFNKQKNKNFLILTSWLIPSMIFAFIKSSELAFNMTDTGPALLIFSILLIDQIVFSTKLKNIKKKIKLPESILSLIIVSFAGIILLLIFNPSFIAQIFSKITERLLFPFGRGRISLTVAENRAPYFIEILRSFGTILWIFFFGILLLFYETIKSFNRKNKKILTFFFIVFMVTFVFSRISPQSLLNGDNFISRFLYFGGLILFLIIILCMYINAHIKKDEKTLNEFKNIKFSYILILSFIFWIIISMRGGIRLFFIISPAIIIISAFLPVKLIEYNLKVKDSLVKLLLWCAIILTIILLIIAFINYTNTAKQSAKWTVSSAYNQQWQKSMSWLKENTPENSIIAHWWDYGYWVQTLGKRPTILDGGHAYHRGFWNYLMGRHVLCGQNETEALEFLYVHNTSYLLIDSTDIGKYSAYSSIGSDETGNDRFSWISTFVLDEKRTQELRNGTKYLYVGGTMLDEDIIWKGQLFPRNNAGISAFYLIIDENGQINSIEAIMVYNNKPTLIPIRYAYINGELINTAKGVDAINSTLYIIPRITQNINNLGAALYLSEKLMDSQMVKLYLFNETENFELVHNGQALYIQQLQDDFNISVGDFLLANNLLGPIKIWKINYPEDFTVEESKLKRYLQKESDLPFPLW